MAKYIPTTQDVLMAYQSEGDGGISLLPDHSEESFYSWLNEQKAQALEDAAKSIELYRVAHFTAEGVAVSVLMEGATELASEWLEKKAFEYRKND